MNKSIKQQLQIHRDMIDDIDHHLIELISSRQNEVKEIGMLKKLHDLPVYDPKRELSTRARRKKLSKKLDLDPMRVEMIFEQIVLLARDSQYADRKEVSHFPKGFVRVGVMGGIASFSESAALQYLKEHRIKNYEIFYPISSENVLNDLEKDKIDLGIFPIENSTAGLVTESIYAASQHQFEILEIFDFDVRHCLHVLPGVKKKNVQKIMSHPQALKQCKGYLKKYFPKAELIDATDTAEGARILEQSPEETQLAVIAPKRAGEIYHLDTLEENIQDRKENFTRFIAAKKLS